jgi:hypothetical protein
VTSPPDELTFDQIPNAILERFPTDTLDLRDVRRRYEGEEEEAWFVSAVDSQVLTPYLDPVLADLDEEAELRRVMQFVERLAVRR